MSEILYDEVLPRTDVREQRSGLLWLVMAAALWGTTGVSSVLLNRVAVVSPFVVVFLRLGFSVPFLIALAYSITRRNPFRAPRRDLFLFVAMGAALATSQLGYFAAIPLAGVTLVTVVTICSSPVIVAVASVFIFAERPTRRVYVALALALFGMAVLVIGQGGGIGGSAPLVGSGMALGAGVAYSAFAILSKIATRRNTDGPQAVAVAFTFGALLLLPTAMASGDFRLDLPLGFWLGTAYLGIVPTGLAYTFFLRGLRSTTAMVGALVAMLEPTVAAVLAWLLLAERLDLIALGGVALMIMSVIVLSITNRT